MRRSVAVAVSLGTALTLSLPAAWGGPASGASAVKGIQTTGRTGHSQLHVAARVRAEHALRTADRVLSGDAPRADASMALLQLRLSMNKLSAADRRRAAAILARPTDHPDFYGESYSVKARQKCAGHICIHWVTTTRDAPPSTHWVDQQLRMLVHVWNYEVKRLGYRPPISDGTRGGGGSGRFDVYLKELYHQGYYGITVAEHPASSNRHLYSSYLLLDNDFKRSQYGADPMQVARVTAAHEFFHAIQYAYDVGADSWLKESTATWMEDQFDDSSNDNRQYLPWSQLRRPGTPLDTFSTSGFEQYGNWAFFEYLSEHFGRRVVRSIWQRAASFHGGGHMYSAAAIRSALRKHGGLTRVFGTYASGNTTPGRSYAEGRFYPAAGSRSSVTLTRTVPTSPWTTYAVRHLASVNVDVRPGADLGSRRWRLRVKVDGPRRHTMPAVIVLVHRTDHRLTRRLVHLSRDGRGSVGVPFGRATTHRVTVTLANASTRFRCHTGGGYSCNGTPTAPHPAFRLRLRALRS
jgi:hypothetical protein